jgi:Protein of unknown function (DUF2490)
LLVCSVAMFSKAPTANSADEDFGAWFAVFANGKLPEPLNDGRGSWRWWLDGALRFGDDASRLSQALIRGGVGYPLSDAWTAWAGYAYIHTEAPYASIPTDENRIWEQVVWNGAISRLKVSSRTRLEQRFFVGGIDTGWRLRESVKLTRPLDSNDGWSLIVSDELFINLNNANLTPNSTATAGLDRNRFFVGPGLDLTRSSRAEFGYMNQYTFRHNGPDKQDHILAVNFFISF